MSLKHVKMEAGWKKILSNEFDKEYFKNIKSTLLLEKENGHIYYPPGPLIFNAFNLTPFDKVRVVIIGQDPYHNPGEAMGLCFSVPKGVRVPPSLKNIYKEIHRDLGMSIPDHGDLSGWADQGVFLLNAMLTVRHKTPGSHKSIGWQKFTDSVISALSANKQGLIFLLWGRFAQSKASLIDMSKHTLLTAAHPSPLARNAFQNCGHFSTTNEILKRQNSSAIDWSL